MSKWEATAGGDRSRWQREKHLASRKQEGQSKVTALQIAQHLNGRKTGRARWMARCPAHDDRKPSLAISEGRTGVLLACMSHHCDFLDIVRSAGLKPLMLRYDYNPNGDFDRKAYVEAHRKALAEEIRSRTLRVVDWIKLFCEVGYTEEDMHDDSEVVYACATVLSHTLNATWESILATHLERIYAATYCRKHRLLPAEATPRKDFP